jgi:hypothetical protein
METFTSEFARYWLAGQGDAARDAKALSHPEELPTSAQREAFEALAERVVAARSVL